MQERTTDGWDLSADVVVLGHGAAGSAAAIEAHESGASVIVLEKMPPGREGGNTRVSGGSWWHNVNPERAAVYLRSLCGDYPVPESVVLAWAEETGLNTEWVEKHLDVTVGQVRGAFEDGGGMPVEFPEMEGSDVYGGQIAVDGKLGSSRLFKALAKALDARGIDVRMATPAKSLITDDATGEVIGVEATSADGTPMRIRALGGVVLATGGFEANPEMVRDYLRLPHAIQWGSPGNTGDGHKMAMKVGADLWHMDNMMAIEGMRVPGHESGMYARFSFRQGFIHVDTDGKRCVNELPRTGHGNAWVNGQYEHVPQRRLHVVFDEATRLSGPVSPNGDMLPVGWSLLVDGYSWSADNSVEIDNGWIHKAETIEGLAQLLDIDPGTLVRTVERWNAACADGEDDQFGRRSDTLVALDQPPYYAFTSAPMLGWSNGGPRRDEHGHVLDPFGEVIPGLFAGGSVSSTYSWCKDGGMHIADALAFGRVAGRNAAQRTEPEERTDR